MKIISALLILLSIVTQCPAATSQKKHSPSRKPSAAYFHNLVTRKQAAYAKVKSDWESGYTVPMLDAASQYIKCLEDMVHELAQFYNYPQFSKGDIDAELKHLYAHERFRVNLTDPKGQGLGSMYQELVYGNYMGGLEQIIVEMVQALGEDVKGFYFRQWKDAWEKASP